MPGRLAEERHEGLSLHVDGALIALTLNLNTWRRVRAGSSTTTSTLRLPGGETHATCSPAREEARLFVVGDFAMSTYYRLTSVLRSIAAYTITRIAIVRCRCYGQ